MRDIRALSYPASTWGFSPVRPCRPAWELDHACRQPLDTARPGGRAFTRRWPSDDALAEGPPRRQGRRATAPLHRPDGDHGPDVRLLGHDREPLRQMDAAGRRWPWGCLRHRVL